MTNFKKFQHKFLAYTRSLDINLELDLELYFFYIMKILDYTPSTTCTTVARSGLLFFQSLLKLWKRKFKVSRNLSSRIVPNKSGTRIYFFSLPIGILEYFLSCDRPTSSANLGDITKILLSRLLH